MQLSLKTLTNSEKAVLSYLIYNLDSNGYLTVPIEEVAKKNDVELVVVNRCLDILHGLEPVGVGARNLQECLLLQVNQKKIAQP